MKTCTFCKTNFEGRGVKYCSLKCAGKARLGLVFSENLGRQKGCKAWNKGIKGLNVGEKNGMWIADRTQVKLDTERGGPLHKQWSMSVKNRDGWKCKISNEDCEGKVVAHHILGWSSYPELRYQLNNGITLCHAHHPLKRAEEKLMIPTFKGLIGLSIGN